MNLRTTWDWNTEHLMELLHTSTAHRSSVMLIRSCHHRKLSTIRTTTWTSHDEQFPMVICDSHIPCRCLCNCVSAPAPYSRRSNPIGGYGSTAARRQLRPASV